MIVLDTNVASEILRPEPDAAVIAWLDNLLADDVVITAISAAEMRTGVARLPQGRRKTVIGQQVEHLIDVDLAGHVLPFDVDTSKYLADIVARRRSRGRPITPPDAYIAAICLQYGATLATRNVRDFAETGVEVIDPWTAT